MNPDLARAADPWLETASFQEGSWWPRWDAWLKERGDGTVKARAPGGAKEKSLPAAPGSYVVAD